MNYWVQGQTIQNGNYTIQEILGEGGFGITYLAIDNAGNQVVIKTLNEKVQQRSDFDEFQKNFLKEAKRLRKCQHNNIVRFYDLIQEGRLWCIVMEYIDGENLSVVLRKQGVLQQADALNYIQQIGNALTVAHRRGILHRDIKPENIILRKNQSEVILIDFGIAREFTPNQINSHTQFLSDGYAPLEQYFRRQKPGDYTDVYALAATLYVLLTGYVQKGGIMSHHLPRAIDRDYDLRHAEPDPLIMPTRINSCISDWVSYAIIKGMELKAKNRPQTVQQWLALLQPTLSVSQAPTISIPGIKPLSNFAITNLTRISGDNNFQELFIGSVIFVFLVTIYIFSPHLTFSQRSSETPENPQSPFSSPKQKQSPPKTRSIETPPLSQKPINEVDYTLLESLLATKKFKDADEETLRIMLLLTNRQKESWFDVQNIENFPCTDLNKINKLWVQYSNRRFGFSIQKKQWINVGGKSGVYDVVVADLFGSRVGWKGNDKWYDKITYELSSPAGHLPMKVTSRVWKLGVPHLAKRLETCNIY